MCGRYTLTSSPEAIRALFRYREEAGIGTIHAWNDP